MVSSYFFVFVNDVIKKKFHSLLKNPVEIKRIADVKKALLS